MALRRIDASSGAFQEASFGPLLQADAIKISRRLRNSELKKRHAVLHAVDPVRSIRDLTAFGIEADTLHFVRHDDNNNNDDNNRDMNS